MKVYLFALIAIAIAAVASPASNLPRSNDTDGQGINYSSTVTVSGKSTIHLVLRVGDQYRGAYKVQFYGLPNWAKPLGNSLIVTAPNQSLTVPICVKYQNKFGDLFHEDIKLIAKPSPQMFIVPLPIMNTTNHHPPLISGIDDAVIPSVISELVLPAPDHHFAIQIVNLNPKPICASSESSPSDSQLQCSKIENKAKETQEEIDKVQKELNAAEQQATVLKNKIQTLRNKKAELVSSIAKLQEENSNLRSGSSLFPTTNPVTVKLQELKTQQLPDAMSVWQATRKNQTQALASFVAADNENRGLKAKFQSLQQTLSKTQATIVTAQEQASYYRSEQLSVSQSIEENKNRVNRARQQLAAALSEEHQLARTKIIIGSMLLAANNKALSLQQTVQTIQTNLTDLEGKVAWGSYNLQSLSTNSKQWNNKLSQTARKVTEISMLIDAINQAISETPPKPTLPLGNFPGSQTPQAAIDLDKVLKDLIQINKDITGLSELRQPFEANQLHKNFAEQRLYNLKHQLLTCVNQSGGVQDGKK